jgi:hypothetical protein
LGLEGHITAGVKTVNLKQVDAFGVVEGMGACRTKTSEFTLGIVCALGQANAFV